MSETPEPIIRARALTMWTYPRETFPELSTALYVLDEALQRGATFDRLRRGGSGVRHEIATARADIDARSVVLEAELAKVEAELP